MIYHDKTSDVENGPAGQLKVYRLPRPTANREVNHRPVRGRIK